LGRQLITVRVYEVP